MKTVVLYSALRLGDHSKPKISLTTRGKAKVCMD